MVIQNGKQYPVAIMQNRKKRQDEISSGNVSSTRTVGADKNSLRISSEIAIFEENASNRVAAGLEMTWKAML